MLCDICTKNEATVHLTEIVDEQMTELHLCEDCAREKSVEMEQQFGLSDLLAGLSDFGKQVEGKEISKIQCPYCKLTYGDFKKIGRLGCSKCYSSFSKYLVPLLKRIHGSSTHMGKFPAGVAAPESIKKQEVKTKEGNELTELKDKLYEAIKLENFEEAAKLRDKIKEMENAAQEFEKPENSGLENGKRKKKA